MPTERRLKYTTISAEVIPKYKGAQNMEEITDQELQTFIAELMRAIYKGMLETETPANVATVEHANGIQSLELTKVPLDVWQHIDIDGKAIIEAVRTQRTNTE
jgi:hypothetical protein